MLEKNSSFTLSHSLFLSYSHSLARTGPLSFYDYRKNVAFISCALRDKKKSQRKKNQELNKWETHEKKIQNN